MLKTVQVESYELHPGVVCVVLGGELDIDTATELGQALTVAVDGEQTRTVTST
ncbi:hypothetical protein [Actinoplanes sp. NPDC049681]|uniref:hypothetical protein n=1 Tax=Actinoplanes sp. NPDC049681 TaxID=3363905 RepID=UPI00378DBADD